MTWSLGGRLVVVVFLCIYDLCVCTWRRGRSPLGISKISMHDFSLPYNLQLTLQQLIRYGPIKQYFEHKCRVVEDDISAELEEKYKTG